MKCKKCNSTKPIVNKFFGLCLSCNNLRLHGSIYGKPIKYIKKNQSILRSNLNKVRTPIKSKKPKNKNKIIHIVDSGRRAGKSLAIYALDEIFYEKSFNQSNHICEECGEKLPEEFRDSSGKVIMRSRYSHIIAKSIAPELRHTLKNINHLCFLCHQKWDFGEKTKMKIYTKNQKLFKKYLK
jgi:chromosome condensin MukBEF MukE localization factor